MLFLDWEDYDQEEPDPPFTQVCRDQRFLELGSC
jgi:hypothetical protein